MSINGENGESRPPRRTLSGRRLSVTRNGSSSRSSFSSNGNLNTSHHGGSNNVGFSSRNNSLGSISESYNQTADNDLSPPPSKHQGGLPPIRWIQDRLDFRGCYRLTQFRDEHGLGRVATLASILTALLATHVMMLLQLFLHKYDIATITALDSLGSETIQLIQQWLQYVVVLTSFHMLEFFVTAIYNPAVTTADSFVVNQSMAYTTAAIVSWVEFWIRFAFFPHINVPVVARVGLVLVTFGQTVRALAMMTCGESFNHLIQQTKKDNHVLITHGIYKYLRHPSYVGFYYWSVGTQLLLGNPISCLCYVAASWYFFKRRIPYEEESLVKHFPTEYPAYVSRTWTGLPFIWSAVKGDNNGMDVSTDHVSFSADGFDRKDS